MLPAMAEIPSRLAAALADRYRLVEELGAGGMATVYLGDDLRHERKVAVKVLRPEVAAVIGGERFIAEIKTTAQLQHPHILPLFDSGEADGFLYYVMPFVEGESLRDRLDRERQLDVDRALHIAKAVASALQYAHERGVIHRDIKPENILLHAGEPVVADFGIALAISAAGGGRLTETGLSLGTPHYMSPEQASADRDLTARSDVYSLACVLYEMLAGQPPHVGPTAQSILVRILTEEPRAITDLRPSVAPHVRAVLDKGLEKLPADRFRSAEDFKAALDDASFTHERVAAPAAGGARAARAPEVKGSGGVRLRTFVTAGVPTVLAAAALGWALGRADTRGPSDEAPVVAFVARDSAASVRPVIGRDGTLVYDYGGALYVRRPGVTEETVLVDETPDAIATSPGFSPDGAWVVFNRFGKDTDRSLRKIPVGGGPQATLLSTQPAPGYGWPLWGDDGWIYVARGPQEGGILARIPEAGGRPEVLLTLERTFVFPSALLPGGRVLLFSAGGPTASVTGRVMALDLASRDTATIIPDGLGAQWSPTGHLVYHHEGGSLWAVPFDPGRAVVTGPAAPVVDDAAVLGGFHSEFSIGPGGTLAYVRGPGVTRSDPVRFALVDLQGRRDTLPLEPTDHWDGVLSPDGRELAYTRHDDIWLYDLDLGANRALTTGGTGQHNPVWSPDGKRVAYRNGDSVYVLSVAGEGQATLVGGARGVDPMDWAEDGTLIAVREGPNSDVVAFSVDEPGAPRPLLAADWYEGGARLSPDRRWLAYASRRSGGMQLYVRSWPDLRGEVQVSEGRGLSFNGFPVWSADGRTLYYGQQGRVQAATLDARDGLEVVKREATGVALGQSEWLNGPAPVGRFLLAMFADPTGDDAQSQLVVVTNWLKVLRERMGEGG